MYKILICDDERDIRNALRIYLTGEGYAVCEADSGLAALELMQREEVQLVLMDIMMPGMDGMTATAKLREQSNVPVILITAKSEDNDKILGLTVGADDYITKPFNPLEVLARVKAQLRRYAQLGGMPEKSTALTLGGIAMDDERKSVTLDGEEVLDNQDLCLLLKVGIRTLQRYRAIGVLPYFTISGKVFYRTKDVHEFIRTRFADVEERAAKRKEKEARKAERRRKRGLFP